MLLYAKQKFQKEKSDLKVTFNKTKDEKKCFFSFKAKRVLSLDERFVED